MLATRNRAFLVMPLVPPLSGVPLVPTQIPSEFETPSTVAGTSALNRQRSSVDSNVCADGFPGPGLESTLQPSASISRTRVMAATRILILIIFGDLLFKGSRAQEMSARNTRTAPLMRMIKAYPSSTPAPNQMGSTWGRLPAFCIAAAVPPMDQRASRCPNAERANDSSHANHRTGSSTASG